jgi:Peptidase family S41
MPPQRPFSYHHLIAANRSRFAGKATREENMATSRPISDPTAKLIEEILQKSGGVRKLKSKAGKVVGRVFNYDRGVIDSLVTYLPFERYIIVDQLRLALSQFYVHLERKKALYNFDPVRALDLLVPTLEKLSNTEFHQSIIQLIAKVRDRHLTFYGKAPYGLSVGLCFSVEQCWKDKKPQYIVTKVDCRVKSKLKKLRVGARVTHWNGVEIDKYLRLNAAVFGDGNDAASFARSLAFLTQRPLQDFGQPLEESVELGFLLGGVPDQERFVWEGLDASEALAASSVPSFAGDSQIVHLQQINRLRFARQSFDDPPSTPVAALGVPRIVRRSNIADKIADYGCVTTQHGTFGYIRMWSFAANDADDFVNEFIDILPDLPKRGLIIDMRGNGGGYITAGERLLQLFTPKWITRLRFQFRVTSATRSMVKVTDQFSNWQQSFEEAFATGEPYSQGYPVEGSDKDANWVGQRYFGPVVIITDALAFSTADMFVAGFIDHDIGRVICADKNMGAAGGNVWPWYQVRMYNPDFTLHPKYRSSFDDGVLSPEIREEFSSKGNPLSAAAKIGEVWSDFDGDVWPICDGDIIVHQVRCVPWMNERLYVYLARNRLGFTNLVGGVGFGITMSRCMRVGKNEGKLIEDLGITPDREYQMTCKDITDENKDLITEASLELTKMPVYDLDIKVRSTGNAYVLTCRTLNLTSVQVFVGDRYLTGGDASDGRAIELSVPNEYESVVAFGFNKDEIAAKSIIVLPSTSSSQPSVGADRRVS